VIGSSSHSVSIVQVSATPQDPQIASVASVRSTKGQPQLFLHLASSHKGSHESRQLISNRERHHEAREGCVFEQSSSLVIRNESSVHVDLKRSTHGSITWSEIFNHRNSNPDLFRYNPKDDNNLVFAIKYIQAVFPKTISETTTRKQTENRPRTETEQRKEPWGKQPRKSMRSRVMAYESSCKSDALIERAC
jgi:hypothetical protein